MPNETDFNKLAPTNIIDEKSEIYVSALDFALKENDIRNIAITGIYGAGKSSVWKMYRKSKLENNKTPDLNDMKGKLKSSITVSLSKFEDLSLHDSVDFNNRVERQIINQIASQIKPQKIGLSKYRYKHNLSIWELCVKVILSISFILSIIAYLQKDIIIGLLDKKIDSNLFFFFDLFMFTIPTIVFFVNLYKKNFVNISKINIKGNEIYSKNEKDDISIFDRDIREIVYLLASSNVKIVVFEDLDRYKNVEIFTKLRELNFLVNSYIETNHFTKMICNSKNEEKIIRFIYMIEDGIFLSKERTKFFDFIIPIIPIVDSKNSDDQLRNLLKNVGRNISDKLLKNIALYIDDMRILKNIVNEYIIYSRIIPFDDLNLDSDKLFAIITIKNIFPKIFDDLQNDRGNIHIVFEKINEFRNSLKGKIQKEIQKLDERIKFINSIIEQNKFEAMALMISNEIYIREPKYTSWSELLRYWDGNKDEEFLVANYYKSEYMDYDCFVNTYVTNTKENREKLDKIPEQKENELYKLHNSKQEYQNDLLQLDVLSYKKLLDRMSADELDELFSILNNENENAEGKDYFGLIRFLLIDGLLDETYWYYKGRINKELSSTFTFNDRIYIKNLLEAKKPTPFFHVDSPKNIIFYLSDSDFSRPNILNKFIILECITQELKDKLLLIMDMIDINDLYDDLIDILVTFTQSQLFNFVKILLNFEPNYIFEILGICKEADRTLVEKILISILSNENIPIETLEIFKKVIEENEVIISKMGEDNFEIMIKNIVNLNVKFNTLSKSNASINRLMVIEKNQSYTLTVENVIYLTRNIGNIVNYEKMLSEIFKSDKLVHLKKYIFNNFEVFVVDYLNYYSQINGEKREFCNDEDVLDKILVSGISDINKINYIKNQTTVITKISVIDKILQNSEIINTLLDNDIVEFNIENLKCLNEGYINSNSFLNYILRHLDNTNSCILKDNIPMCDSLLQYNKSPDNIIEMVSEYKEKNSVKFFAHFSRQSVGKLIVNGVAKVDKYNIDYLLEKKYYDELVSLTILSKKEEDVLDILMNYDLDDELIYILINSNVNEKSVMRIINSFENLELGSIKHNKTMIIREILDNRLSDENINFIITNFAEFSLKEEFIENLNTYDIIPDFSDEQLQGIFIDYLLKSKNIKLYDKVEIINKKIENNCDVQFIKEYISQVDEVSSIATIWQGKYPEFKDNQYKAMIAESLIKNGYAKERGDKRLMCLKNLNKISWKGC